MIRLEHLREALAVGIQDDADARQLQSLQLPRIGKPGHGGIVVGDHLAEIDRPVPPTGTDLCWEALQLEKWLTCTARCFARTLRSKNITSPKKVRKMNDITARRAITEPNLGSAETLCRLLLSGKI